MDKIEKIIKLKSIKKDEKLSRILKYIFVDVCKMNQKKYYILGSYALRNSRKINDLDINVDKDEFMKLEEATKKGFGKLEFLNNQIRWFFDLTKVYNKLTKSREKDFSIEAFMKDSKVGYPNNKFSLSKLIKNDGLDKDKNKHQYLNLKFLLKWKKTMGREKDKADIELIKKLLE
tara:strand:- start:828 stop:1352 length:525 start_codon:yes stop_codon:yes gene_type:complete